MPNIEWSKLGFGFSDVNCHIRYTWKDGAWSEGEFVKDPFITMHIGASCLHYGQECFEGMKAFRQQDGKIVIFRPEENAKRMYRTAVRTVMPPVPEEMFLDAAAKVVAANEEYVPPYGTGGSLYLRPLLIGTGPQIGVAPAQEYTFMIMVMPVGATPICGPVPIRSGRRYMEPPVPYGGTYSALRLTTALQHSRNVLTGIGGMHVRSAVRYILFAFSSGRNMTTFPLFCLNALMPSKHSCP